MPAPAPWRVNSAGKELPLWALVRYGGKLWRVVGVGPFGARIEPVSPGTGKHRTTISRKSQLEYRPCPRPRERGRAVLGRKEST